MQINWLYVGLGAFVVYGCVFGFHVRKRQWTRAALGVGLANMLYVVLNLVAPFRGVLDPGYAGYNVGLLHIAPGIMVTLATGSVVAASLASACFAVQNRPGGKMAFVAGVDTVLLVLFGLPILYEGLTNLDDFRIELGEYLQIPGIVAVLIGGLLFTFPLIAAIIWSTKRIRPADREST